MWNKVKGRPKMTGNKKVFCKACYKELKSDHLTRHTKQHSKKIESYPVTNTSVTNNVNNTKSIVSTH